MRYFVMHAGRTTQWMNSGSAVTHGEVFHGKCTRGYTVRPEVGICYIFAYYVILEVNISLCLC